MLSFSWSLATAIMFSQLSHWEWLGAVLSRPFSANSIIQSLVSLSALGLLLKPNSFFRLRLVAATLLLDTFWFLPEVPNHRLALSAICVAILCFGPKRDKEELSTNLVTSVWALGLVLYFFAFFHKLNLHFISEETSCAVAFLGNISESLKSISFFRSLSIWGTLLLEGLIIFGLVVSRTRKVFVVLGMLFHLVLSADLVMHFLDFSSVMFCVLLLFVEVSNGSGGSTSLSWPTIQKLLPRFLFCAFLFLIVYGLFFGSSDRGYEVLKYLRQAVWLLYAILVLSIVLCSSKVRQNPRNRNVSYGVFLLVFIVFLNGLSPYLGLKTRTAFSMYSNLHVSQDYSNHLIAPPSLDIFGLIADRVAITGPKNSSFLALGQEIPYSTFEYLLSKSSKEFAVEYTYQGRTYKYPEQPLPKSINPLIRKFTLFKAIGRKDSGACIW